MSHRTLECFVAFLFLCGLPAVKAVTDSKEGAPYLNTWLIAGTFNNDEANTGFVKDWIGEATVQPEEGEAAGSSTWRYFDDRLFTRAYDCYNDVFSYYRVKRKESAAAKVVYAHTWVFSPQAAEAELAVGADNEFKSWFNGEPVCQSEQRTPWRDSVKASLKLQAGWNRLLLKVANQNKGRLGFYARLSDQAGRQIPGLVYSVNGPVGKKGRARRLAISTRAMADIASPPLPTAYKEWPYGAMDTTPYLDTSRFFSWRGLSSSLAYGLAPWSAETHAVKAPEFRIQAEGGVAPYRFKLATGKLPAGLSMAENGAVGGTVAAAAASGDYPFKVKVTDAKGDTAVKRFALTVKERPNKWVEEARLIGLIHAPQAVADADIPAMAKLMKRQGYQVAMPIGYGNGWPDRVPRWPSDYHAVSALTGTLAKYRTAMENEGIVFGMYLGELGLPEHLGQLPQKSWQDMFWLDGPVLLVEEAMRVCKPKVVYLDEAGVFFESADAYFSVIRACDPDIVIIKNGYPTLSHGDWDILCMEGIGKAYETLFDLWPVRVEWPKKARMESWRHLTEPGLVFGNGQGPLDPAQYLRLQLSLIGDGYIADIDHSAWFGSDTNAVVNGVVVPDKSVMWQCHAAMADWSSPATGPSLVESFTRVVDGPLPAAEWGYNLLDAATRKALYLHLMSNGVDRVGFDAFGAAEPAIKGIPASVEIKKITLLNRGVDVTFSQRGGTLSFTVPPELRDTVDTVLKCDLAAPAEPMDPVCAHAGTDVNNLAYGKPCQILSLDTTHPLPPNFGSAAEHAVDGDLKTMAVGCLEWAWTLQVDLQTTQSIQQVGLVFGRAGFASQYQIKVSTDGKAWKSVVDVPENTRGGRFVHTFNPVEARYLQVCSLKPNDANQLGGQMAVAELEVYEKPQALPANHSVTPTMN